MLFQFLLVSLRIGLDGGDAIAPVGRGVANHLALSVNSPVGRLHHHFCTTVAIEVVYHKLCVMSTCADVVSQIDAPQLCTIQPVAVDIGVSSKSGKHIVFGIRGVPLQEYLILSVTIHITDAGVIGMIGVALPVGRNTVGRLIDGNGQIAVGRAGLQRVGAVFTTPANLVGGISAERFLVGEESTAFRQWLLVQLLSVTVYVERLAHFVCRQGAPADNDLVAVANGDDTTVQCLTFQFAHVVAGLAPYTNSSQ